MRNNKIDSLLLWGSKIGIFTLLFVPLVFWYPILFPLVSTKVFFVFVLSQMVSLLFVWLLWRLPSLHPPADHPLVKAVVVYVAVILLSTIFSVYPSQSFWGTYERSESVLVWIHLLAIFLIVISLFRTKKDWLQIAGISTVVGIIVSAVFLLNAGGLFPFFSYLNSGSTFGNSSFLGTYLIFAIFFSLFLFFQSESKKGRWFGLGSFGLFVLTLSMTDARAATLAVFGGAIIFVSLSLMFNKRTRVQYRVGLVLLGFLVFVSALFVILVFLPNSFLHHFIILNFGGSRFVLWKIARQAWLARPLFGWGLENFQYAFLSFFDTCFGTPACGTNTFFDRAHNNILDVLVTTGFAGLLAYLSLLGFALLSIWSSVKKQLLSSHMAALLVATICAYFVQALTVFDTITSNLFFLFLLAYVVSLSSPRQEVLDFSVKTDKQGGSWRSVVAIGFTLSVPILFFFTIIQPVLASHAVYSATSLEKTSRSKAYDVALGSSLFGRDIRAIYLGFDTARILWSYDPVKNKDLFELSANFFREEMTKDEEALQQTIVRSPNDIRASIYLSMLLQARARLYRDVDFSSAEKVAIASLRLNPRSQRLRWILVSLYLEEGRLDEARTMGEEAYKLSSGSKSGNGKFLLLSRYLNDDSLIGSKVSEEQMKLQEFQNQYDMTRRLSPTEDKYAMLLRFYDE
ncbi:O-antigen ligase family protein [Candidatus Uhrbacteria bacterium]|nr:O-antigen ligase family protein [Candidatus Uhrbacteria bacterium]